MNVSISVPNTLHSGVADPATARTINYSRGFKYWFFKPSTWNLQCVTEWELLRYSFSVNTGHLISAGKWMGATSWLQIENSVRKVLFLKWISRMENFLCKMWNEIQVSTPKIGCKARPLEKITASVLRYAQAAWPDFSATSSNLSFDCLVWDPAGRVSLGCLNTTGWSCTSICQPIDSLLTLTVYCCLS